MRNTLQTTLLEQTNNGWQSNAATKQIIEGYAHYHAVLAITGSVFLIIFAVIAYKAWLSFKKVPKIRKFKWPFEKKIYFLLTSLSVFIVMFLGLIVAANISTASKPLPGFTGSIDSINDSAYNTGLHQGFNDWIVSGETKPPAIVAKRIHERRLFHIKRLIFSTLLLIGLSYIGLSLWRDLIDGHKTGDNKWTLKELLKLSGGLIIVVLVLFFMLSFMANMQSMIVPIANALQFG